MSFLGDPESALFVGMSLRDAFNTKDPADPAATAPIRIGINLGPVKLVKDINGHPNIVGDGINVAQRIMSFADSGQILVSRSFHDVVSCLSDDYAALFRFEGSRTDKHVRDHEVYAVGDSEAALSRAKRGVAQRAEPMPTPRPKAATAAGETLRRAQTAATAFLHDRRKVTITGSVLGALIVVLAVVLVVRKPAEVKAPTAAASIAGAPAAQVAAQEPEKAPAATAAPSSAAAVKPAPAKAEAAATGTVSLAVQPWGEVFVNGRSRGVSPPLKNLKLAPGTYSLEVRNTTFAPLKQKVRVKAREEVTVRHVFK
jgi:hypothetical protein